jgi:NAD(P)-dependent dehydrogenase (short-subunit alcohol dehydrogenase family)
MTRLTTPFGARSTATEVLEGVELRGKRFLVTGAASGLGIETTRALANAGARVTMAVRDLLAGQRIASEISLGSSGYVDVVSLELNSAQSIASLAISFDGPLHGLICNAGIMATPESRTAEGWELQFATNHLGHFRLAHSLQRALAAGAPSRIVCVSSIGHRRSPVMFDDINFRQREYDPWAAYGQSKTANVLFAVGAAERWRRDGITANALHPGGIMTNLQRHMDPAELRALGWVREDGSVMEGFKSPEQGAATSVFLAASPLAAEATGRYFEDVNEALPATSDDRYHGVESYALDLGLADRLWELSARAIGR